MNINLSAAAQHWPINTRSYDDYYASIYDPSFFSRSFHVTQVGNSSVITSRKNGIEWDTWREINCSSTLAQKYFHCFEETPPSMWKSSATGIGRDDWSLIALLHAEMNYRSGKFDNLRQVCRVIQCDGVREAEVFAQKLSRAADALVFLNLNLGDSNRTCSTDRIVEEAVRFVMTYGSGAFGPDPTEFVTVEDPVRIDFNAKGIDLSNESDVLDFYKSTYSYVLELTAANNQVETLNNYQCCLDVIINRKKQHLYDYGGGIGTLALLAHRRGIPNVTMGDLAGRTLDFARERAEQINAPISFSVLDGSGIVSLHNFDVICCTEVVEHIFDPEFLLRRLTSSLPHDGLFVVSESFDYTKEFCTHLPRHRGKGGRQFVEFMASIGWRQVPETSKLHCQVFERI